MRKLVSVTLLVILSLGIISCDSSIPPGVNKKEVLHVPKSPDFNAHIRPLLWKLANQESPTHSQRWTQVKKEGLDLETLKQWVSDDSLGGAQSAESLTLIWRWAKADGSVNHPKWLHSSLSPTLSDAPVKELKEHLPTLSHYWLHAFSKDKNPASPFGSFLSEKILSRQPYHQILQTLYTRPEAQDDSTEQISTYILASHPAATLSKLLGVTDTQQAAELFTEFSYQETRPLYSDIAHSKLKTSIQGLTEHSTKFNVAKASTSAFTNWSSSSPAYIPLIVPTHHSSFNNSSTKGYFESGQALTDTPLLLKELNKSPSAISYWIQGTGTITLRGADSTLSLSLRAEEVRLNDAQELPFFSVPHQVDTQQWNHILYAVDYSHPQGFSLYLNGELINPARPVFTSFPAPALNVLTHGKGVIDELKIFTSRPLSHLESASLYRYTTPQNALTERENPDVISHFNYGYNVDLKRCIEEGGQLHSRHQTLLKQGLTETILPTGIDFKLTPGTYFKDAIPLTISTGDLAELTPWLTEEASPWLARATVNWVHEALTGLPLINMNFPQDALPENWEQIDQWSSDLIKSNWNLQRLAGLIQAHNP